jgi:dipeptidyl aminopeptidase/acylaminoacyl peptidase
VKLNGKATQLPGVQKGTKSSLKVSPDGKWIAFLGDVSEEDPWGVHNNHLWVVGIGGGESQCLSKSDDYCLSVSAISDTKEAAFDGSCMWSQDSKQVYVQLGWHGEVQLGVATVGKTKLEPLTKGLHVLGFGTINKAGSKMACSYSSATKLSEIGWITLGKSNEIKVLSELNKAVLSKLDVLEPEEIWLDSSDGVKLHAWVIKPRDFQNKKKYPAVLQVHGGPHTQYGWTFFHEFQVLAAAGYFVFYSNPRGSKGYGERFCAAIKNSWGDKDWEDIQTITRYMQHHPNVRAGEMGVMGGSYGGYMTNWVIGHTKDFKTAITDRCVSNLVSMAGNSDFPSNKDEYFGGCAWGDHERIKDLWRQSPLAYFEGVTTPTLVIHSEGDLRCNVEQGEQVFSALQLQGVESRFVRYPQSTFHGLSRSGPPDLRIHRLHEILTWWKNHLKGGG